MNSGNIVDNSANPPIPLLPQGQGAEFAAALDPKTQSQTLIAVDSMQGLNLLEQDDETRLWKSTPFNIPSSDHYAEFPSYSTRLTVIGQDGLPVRNAECVVFILFGNGGSRLHDRFILKCSSWLHCTVNGRSKLLTREGTSVKTDAGGAITIINRTSDFSTYFFALQDTPGNDYIPGEEAYFIDPSEKAME